jgi:hypothetical protein
VSEKCPRAGALGTVSLDAGPRERPLIHLTQPDLVALTDRSIAECGGFVAAHAIHERWMRGEIGSTVDRLLDRLWTTAADSVPEWLPMRHIAWLALAYDVAARFVPASRGRCNVYLILLDYADATRGDPHGVYVGASRYAPAARFDQHKAGIRPAGSVLKRGVEPLTGPTAHLKSMSRGEADRIEAALAAALRAAGLIVRGGH